jgi:hypothetical protein
MLKFIEPLIKQKYLGLPLSDTSGIQNPESLDAIPVKGSGH